MIKKFEEFVNERLFNSNVARLHNGGERLEDSLRHNLKSLKPIDIGLPFYFANDDFMIDGEYGFEWKEVEQYKHLFEEYGWRMMTSKDIDDSPLIDEDVFRIRRDEDDITIISLKNPYVELNVDAVNKGKLDADWKGWLDPIENEGAGIYLLLSTVLGVSIFNTFPTKSTRYRIRLIRDKE